MTKLGTSFRLTNDIDGGFFNPKYRSYSKYWIMPLQPGSDDYEKEAGASGRVLTRFIINADGSVSDVEIYKSAHPLLDAEALRVVNEMPNWEPGKVGGKAVKVRYALPLVFKLQ